MASLAEAEARTERLGVARPPSYSPSKLTAASRCGAAYSFRYEHKIPTPKKANIELGSWLDEVLNTVWRHQLVLRVPHPLNDAIALAKREFQTRIEDVFTGTETDGGHVWDQETPMEVAKKRCIAVLEKYLLETYKTMEPVEIQPWVELPAGHVGKLRMIGKLDLIAKDRDVPGFVIVDHKVKSKGFYSAGKKTSQEALEKSMAKSRVKLRRDMQMNLYAAALAERTPNEKTGHQPIVARAIRWIGLIWTKEPQIQVVEVPVTAGSIAWALQAAQGAARIIEAGDFKPNPLSEYCGTCEYGKVCEEKFGSM